MERALQERQKMESSKVAKAIAKVDVSMLKTFADELQVLLNSQINHSIQVIRDKDKFTGTSLTDPNLKNPYAPSACK